MPCLVPPAVGFRGRCRPRRQQVADDERSLVADAFRAAVEHGDPVIVSCRLHTCDGSVRSVLVTAERSDDGPNEQSMSALLRMNGLAAATGPWLAGQVVDLTTLRLGATRAATNHAVSEAWKHRAVIEQAKGMLMVTHQDRRRHRVRAAAPSQPKHQHQGPPPRRPSGRHTATLHLDETIPAQVEALLHHQLVSRTSNALGSVKRQSPTSRASHLQARGWSRRRVELTHQVSKPRGVGPLADRDPGQQSGDQVLIRRAERGRCRPRYRPAAPPPAHPWAESAGRRDLPAGGVLVR